MTEGRAMHLVPHTHWDREWYEPFQRFRLRLVDLLDDVLDRAEEDSRLAGAPEARLVGMGPEPVTAVLRGRFRTARRVDLLGRPGAELPVRPAGQTTAGESQVELALRPWEIATVRLDG
jgi:alpha-mannosidase